MKNGIKAVVLAAGKGTRLRTEGVDLPKVLRQAAGRPLLGYVLEELSFLEKEDVVLVVGYEREKVLAAYPLLYDFNHSRPRDVKYREDILRKVFAETGETIYIEPPLNANWGCNTHVGENFYANFNLTLVDDADIFIGNNVMIAPNVVIATGAHPICPELRAKSYQYNLPRPVYGV